MLQSLREFFGRLLCKLRSTTRIGPDGEGLFSTLISRQKKRR